MKVWTPVRESLFPKGLNNQRRKTEPLIPIIDYGCLLQPSLTYSLTRMCLNT